MRTVKTKKELIKAIEDGERSIIVDSKRLYAACKLAEEYDSVKTLLKHYVFTKLADVAKGWGAMHIQNGAVVTITISVLIATIAIIGILNDKKVKIKCKGYGLDGEVEIG